MHRISFIALQGAQSLNFLNCSGFFFFFGAGSELEKIPFVRLVLELFLNSEFLAINVLGYSIYDCPLFGSPLCDEILFQFSQRQPY